MKIAFQMDKVESINPATDSTYLLALEAEKRGFDIYYYTPIDLYLDGDQLLANITKITFHNNLDNYYTLGDAKIEKLDTFDFIFVRQDPPFDMRYITNTYLLSKIQNRVTIINNPEAIRNYSEKIYAHDFAEYMTKTLISENIDVLQDAYTKFGDVVIKPLYAYGGIDVVLIKANNKSFTTKAQNLINKYQTPIIIQTFLPEVSDGDTRVLLACGQVVGQILRTPAANQIKANLCAGGTAGYTRLSTKQTQIAKIIAKETNKLGLYFVGLDFIGDYLTEINVTSPTGIKQASDEMQENLPERIWDLFLTIENS